MQLILPQGISETRFNRAMDAFASVVGRDWVLATDADRDTYLDAYAPGNESAHAPSAAIAPASTEEVQAIVRLANEHGIPLWPISRGKNLGYGGSAPAMAGSVVLDLTRMNRILEVDEKLAYCVIEPGVGFYDLYEYLTANDIPLWMGIPGNAWGSVIGNALDRGFSSRTSYGEHTASLCGLEVVLPNGELIRTGTGAMGASATGSLFKYGFGPGWDQMFVQSNYGVVTRAGFWLMPEPESMTTMRLQLPNPGDIGWLVDTLTPLCIEGVIKHRVSVPCYTGSATMSSQRDEWYQGNDALPDDVVDSIIERNRVGWWNTTVRLYGDADVNAIHQRRVEAAIEPFTDARFETSVWKRGEPAGAPRPSVRPLQLVNWHGGRGGHMDFSPILPAAGSLVLQQLERTRRLYRQFGIDYSGTFYLCGRHVININLMIYDRDDADMTRRARGLFSALIRESAAAGFAEYRTHLSYMDDVAATFDFNDHSLDKLNHEIKDLLDPNGIIAPGKSGIWPRKYRDGDG